MAHELEALCPGKYARLALEPPSSAPSIAPTLPDEFAVGVPSNQAETNVFGGRMSFTPDALGLDRDMFPSTPRSPAESHVDSSRNGLSSPGAVVPTEQISPSTMRVVRDLNMEFAATPGFLSGFSATSCAAQLDRSDWALLYNVAEAVAGDVFIHDSMVRPLRLRHGSGVACTTSQTSSHAAFAEQVHPDWATLFDQHEPLRPCNLEEGFALDFPESRCDLMAAGRGESSDDPTPTSAKGALSYVGECTPRELDEMELAEEPKSSGKGCEQLDCPVAWHSGSDSMEACDAETSFSLDHWIFRDKRISLATPDSELRNKYDPQSATCLQWLQRLASNGQNRIDFSNEQIEALDGLSRGRDVIAVLPTGAGKSVLYQIPPLVLGRGSVALVVSPLLALMDEQVQSLSNRGISATRIGSDMTRHAQEKALDALAERWCFSSCVSIVYVSPERLAASEQKGDRFWEILRQLFREDRLCVIAVDEAHCIVTWNEWRKAYLQLGRLREEFPGVPVLALTATASPASVREISQVLRCREPIEVRRDEPRLNLRLIFRERPPMPVLARDIAGVVGSNYGIVFVDTRATATRLSDMLGCHGVRAAAYHAGLANRKRRLLLQEWLGGGGSEQRVRVLVSTSVLSFGVHHPEVAFVGHVGIPASITQYVQEIGRCSRGGGSGVCISWVKRTDFHARLHRGDRCEGARASLKEMFDFAMDQETCRHAALIRLMGGTMVNVARGACSACVPEPGAEAHGQLAMSAKPPKIAKTSMHPCRACNYSTVRKLGKFGPYRKCTNCSRTRNVTPVKPHAVDTLKRPARQMVLDVKKGRFARRSVLA
jgi:ATP-dependent DNA helicase RecQ